MGVRAGEERMTRLGLHHLTALDVSPIELVTVAEAVGCQEVCLFTHCPPTAAPFPVLRPRDARELSRRLDGAAISVASIEFFPLEERPPFELYLRGIELGAAIGGRRIVTHVFDFDRARAMDNFCKLCGMAAEHGLEVGLEFMALSPAMNSLGKAIDFVANSGRRNAAVAIDILHLMRSGGTVAEVETLSADQISYVQICDGPSTMPVEFQLPEAAGERMIPGQGEFPLVKFVGALPVGVAMDVEVPLKAMTESGVAGLERAKLAVDATRRILAAAGR